MMGNKDAVRAEMMAEWATFRQTMRDEDGRVVPHWPLIERRIDQDPRVLPLCGVIGSWSLRETAYGIRVIHGFCLVDYRNRGFGWGTITTSVIVKIEGGYAVTLNSVYRLLTDAEHAAVMRGDTTIEDILK